MGTRATIKFEDGSESFFVYRGHDGHPENILPDLEEILKLTSGRWSEPEIELLVTAFLSQYWDLNKERIPEYNITSGWHGDESYCYNVKFNKDEKAWKIRVIEKQPAVYFTPADIDAAIAEYTKVFENAKRIEKQYSNSSDYIAAFECKIKILAYTDFLDYLGNLKK